MRKLKPDSLNKRLNIYVSDEDADALSGILKEYLPEKEVVVFGSRVSGENLTPYSDIDICIMGDEKADASVRIDLKEALSLSDMTIKVDLVYWSELSDNFKQIISEQNIQLL